MCDKKATFSRGGKCSVDVQGLRSMIGTDGCGGVSNIRLEPHGYVCVMNAPDKQAEGVSPSAPISSKNILDQQNNFEHAFFTEWNMTDLLKSERAGGNALVARLDRTYSQYLNATWLPNTILQLVNKEIVVRKNMQKLGQPGGDFNGLVSIESFTYTILNGPKQFLESLQKNMCTVRSEIFRRLMNCGGATNGLVQRDFDNHAAAAKSLSEIKMSFLADGRAAVGDVLTFLEATNNLPSRAFTADTSEFKFSRFPEVVNRMDKLYAQEVDVIAADIVTEIERLIQVHFTLPYPAIQINFNLNSGLNNNRSGDTVSLAVQVTKIANDILYSILASLFFRLEEGLNRCFQDVLSKPNLWVENCIVARRCFREEAGRIEGVLGKIIDMVGGPSVTIQQVLQGVRGTTGPSQNSSIGRQLLLYKGLPVGFRDQNSQEGDCWDVLTKLRYTIT